MRLPLPTVAAFLLTSLLAAAASAPAPRISRTFPPVPDLREPDRVLDKTARRATDILAYSPDGRMIAGAGMDKNVRVWESRTGDEGKGALLETYPVESASVTALAFSPDNTLLYALAEDQTLNIWNVANGRSPPNVKVKANPRVALFRPGADAQLAECTALGAKLW